MWVDSTDDVELKAPFLRACRRTVISLGSFVSSVRPSRDVARTNHQGEPSACPVPAGYKVVYTAKITLRSGKTIYVWQYGRGAPAAPSRNAGIFLPAV